MLHDVYVSSAQGCGEAPVETIGMCQQMYGAPVPAVPEGQGDFHPCKT
tara:strand:+ start:203 stop:346 length:144 start_codon:yes stop_codon:yes gene_type:complete